MANNRIKERFELALDAKQVCAVLIGSLVILGGVFVLGMSVGRQAAGVAQQAIAAPKDALARLDEPLPAREEPAPVLKAHQALTDARPIDKALPVPQVKPTTVSIASAAPVDPILDKPAAPPPAVAEAGVAGSVAPAAAPSPRPAAKPSRPPPDGAAHHDRAAKHAGYAIQVGSAPHRADAERLAKKLASRNPRVISADVPGKGRWYRVVIGSYATQEAAKRQLASLSRSGVHGIVTAVR